MSGPTENQLLRMSLIKRIAALDPALFKGVIVGVVAVLSALGVVISPSIPDSLVTLIAAVAALVQAFWVRSSVTPDAKVILRLPDPINNPQLVESGPAVPPTGMPADRVIDRAYTEGN